MENKPQPAPIPQTELQEPVMPNVAMSISDKKMRDASTGQFASPEVWNQYEDSKAAYDTQQATKAETIQNEAEKTSLYERLSALPEGTDHGKLPVSEIADKAGLSWKQAYEMGNSGFSDLMKEAKDWKNAKEPKPLTAAEQRQSEYAALLKTHDQATLAGATRQAERNETETAIEPEKVEPKPLIVPAIELPAVTPEPSGELVHVSSTELVPAASPESDNLPVIWKAPGELVPIESGEPIDQGGWLRRGFNRAKNAILLAPVNVPRRVGEWARQHFSQEDEDGERQVRWGKAAVAVGGLAVAVAGVYVASKGFVNGGHAAAMSPQPGSGGGTGGEVTAQALGWTDTIKSGDGLTNSIIDYAHQNGIADINPQRALDIFKQLNAEHLIDSAHVTGSVPMDVVGNVGYAAPGQSMWSTETVARMHELLGLH